MLLRFFESRDERSHVRSPSRGFKSYVIPKDFAVVPVISDVTGGQRVREVEGSCVGGLSPLSRLVAHLGQKNFPVLNHPVGEVSNPMVCGICVQSVKIDDVTNEL